MRAIVVGAGGATRQLLHRLGEGWDVVVVDVDADQLARLATIRDVETHLGDGSSLLVLRRCGLAEADALIAATDDDDVNLEAVRMARDAGLLRVLAVVDEAERRGEFHALGVDVVAPDALAARFVEVHLEPRRVASTAFAGGKAEAIEFTVSPDSTVRGRALRELHSETWIVAAVLRDGELIVPHGTTRLEAGDQVTVVGAAADFASIVRTFTAGEARFPLNFGRKVAVVVDTAGDLEGPLAAAIALVRGSQAEELLVVHRDPAIERDVARAEEVAGLLERLGERAEGVELDLAPVDGPPVAALRERCASESIGVVVLPRPGGRGLLGRLRWARALERFGPLGRPLLFAGAPVPGTKIVVPARRTPAGEAAGRAGIDLARSSGAALVGVAVVSPAFVGRDDLDEARRAAAWLREEAAVQGVAVRRHVRRGNPVRVLVEEAADASLLVLGMPEPQGGRPRLGITGQVLRRVRGPVLLVPPAT